MKGDLLMRRTAPLLAAALPILVLLGACGDDDSKEETAPRTAAESLAIVSPAEGASIKGNVVTLDVEPRDIAIVKPDGDTSGRTGHYHVFIDRDAVAPGEVIPREAGVVHTADDPITITGLAPGSHRLVVVYGNGVHARIGTAEAERTVLVEGPSVKASAPATVAAGQPVTVTMEVDGLSLVKADGDTSGRSGHLHLFVDTPPTPAGQPIPLGDARIIHTADTTATIPDLPPGEHTIWVVAGDGTHVPLAAGVKDKVTVTVT
jgi:hypothetical protein